jgi:hypothetical protein
MKIAILGWGSLIWEDGTLAGHVRGKWKPGGPELPLEFSRKSTSRDGALTLVIDSAHGQATPTRFITSSRRTLKKARLDLKEREGVPSVDSIGYTNATSGDSRGAPGEILKAIREWAKKNGYGAVIWTALQSNFDNFALEQAVQYLRELPPKGKRKAKEYIEKAPEEVDTPLRRAVRRVNW